MPIDWVTVIAQIANFAILVWLLQRVLYRPLMRALDERRANVDRRLLEAEAARREAEAEARAHREALQELEQARGLRLQELEAEIEALRAEMTQAAREEARLRREAWRRQVEDEKADFLNRLRRRAGDGFVTLARRSLADMADEDLSDRMARVFARRLSELGPEDRAALRQAARADGGARVLSSLRLSAGAQADIARAVAALLDASADVDFQQDGEIDCGVALQVGSRRLGWTLGEHLDALEEDVAAFLDLRLEGGGEPWN